MAKNDIKNLVENSKNEIENDYNKSVQSIKDDLKSFKKKTLDQI